MKPFDTYPDDRVKLLPRRTGANARHEYGLELQRLTGQHECAYCGVDLVHDYYHWLLLSVDHVIPVSECRRLGIPEGWADSYSNTVLSCSGCNGLDNRFRVTEKESRKVWTLEQFFRLRNHVFALRKARIQAGRERALQFFESQPWLTNRARL